MKVSEIVLSLFFIIILIFACIRINSAIETQEVCSEYRTAKHYNNTYNDKLEMMCVQRTNEESSIITPIIVPAR